MFTLQVQAQPAGRTGEASVSTHLLRVLIIGTVPTNFKGSNKKTAKFARRTPHSTHPARHGAHHGGFIAPKALANAPQP